MINSAYARLVLALAPAVFLANCREPEATASPEHPPLPWKWEPADPELALGKAAYEETCHLCHNEGEEGAPRLTNSTEWEKRAAKGEDTLLAHALEGYRGESGRMPARGGNDAFTDEQVIAAVKFMIAAPK